MDISELAVIGVAAVIVIAGIVAYFRGGGSVTLEAAVDAITDIEKAGGAAREFVLAAEQLWRTGRLDKDSRLSFALERLKETFPEMDEQTLIDSVEAAVSWFKLIAARRADPLPTTGPNPTDITPGRQIL